MVAPGVNASDKNDRDSVSPKPGDKNVEESEIEEGFVKEKVDQFEEMNQRENTPDDLKSVEVEQTRAPLSTTPPDGGKQAREASMSKSQVYNCVMRCRAAVFSIKTAVSAVFVRVKIVHVSM